MKGQTPHEAFRTLLATAARLQALGGCPWDRAQTIHSLLPHLIEETWEVFEAAKGRRRAHLREELGDLLYTVLFLMLIGERRGWWRIGPLLHATRLKMVRRHPHVFGARSARRTRTPRAAYREWQRAKRAEAPVGATSVRNVRLVLTACWDVLLRDPRAADALRQWAAARSSSSRKASGRSRRPSARPTTRSARWRGPTRGRSYAGRTRETR